MTTAGRSCRASWIAVAPSPASPTTSMSSSSSRSRRSPRSTKAWSSTNKTDIFSCMETASLLHLVETSIRLNFAGCGIDRQQTTCIAGLYCKFFQAHCLYIEANKYSARSENPKILSRDHVQSAGSMLDHHTQQEQRTMDIETIKPKIKEAISKVTGISVDQIHDSASYDG